MSSSHGGGPQNRLPPASLLPRTEETVVFRQNQDDLALAAEAEPFAARDLQAAIARGTQRLESLQYAQGYWVGELEGDSILQSEYILLLAWLGRHGQPLAHKLARRLLEQQEPHGGWVQFPGGPIDISASVKAYFALKLTGHAPSCPALRRAREAILAHGGADSVNSFTRFYLALLGQVPFSVCPAVPPELVLLPRWSPICLENMSAWTRTIVVPLSIIWALQPARPVPGELGIRELFLRPPQAWPPLRCPGLESGGRLWSWDRFFRTLDRLVKRAERWKLLPRKRAVRVATQWMLDRFPESDGLGAIFPPMVWSVIALSALGHDEEGPELAYCHRTLQGLVIEEEDTARVQPCKSPVWDTALALRALAAVGHTCSDRRVQSAAAWLLDREVRKPGDWARRVRAEPGGWYFEFANEFYPDLDDTAMTAMALVETLFASPVTAPPGKPPPDMARQDVPPGDSPQLGSPQFRAPVGQAPPEIEDLLHQAHQTLARAEAWMLAMQNRDGGWGAFDRDNDARFLCHVPFADHNAMIDPSTPDLTGRVLEALARLGRRLGDPAVDRAVLYLHRTQQADGSWFGRWGVNYIYGTWQAIAGLRAVGMAPDDPCIVHAAHWLLAWQQPCGGWGETPHSYAEPALRGQGEPTASQTAWALLGLIEAGLAQHPAVTRGIEYLLRTQAADGSWPETAFTGTGFPRVFYLRYHLYPLYFPLLALARWASCCLKPRVALTEPPALPGG